MSTLKRGIATTPRLIHRIYVQSLPKNSWLRPYVLRTTADQSSPKLRNTIKVPLMPEELRHRTYKVGDNVFVKAEHFRTTQPSKKLSEKNLGPFEIIAQVGRTLFTLRLPDQLQAVHPVFHSPNSNPKLRTQF